MGGKKKYFFRALKKYFFDAGTVKP